MSLTASLPGQLTSIDPGALQAARLAKTSRWRLRGARSAAPGWSAIACASCSRAAVDNGHPPLLLKDDGRRGIYLIAPFPLYCFDMDLVRRAHEQAAADAHEGRSRRWSALTCDYSPSRTNQGRTQEGGLDLLSASS